jgi:hypothetical protein
MSEATAIPVLSSSARRRYLALGDDGWRLTTPPPPANYRLLHSWLRGEGRRLDLEVTDDGDGWRLSVHGWGPTDIIVGRRKDALREAIRYFLPLVDHSLAEAFA